jgi:hypothetical protein
MGAGPFVMYASHALEAFTQFAEHASSPSLQPAAPAVESRPT